MTLAALQTVNLVSLTDTVVSLASAFVLGGAIGLERQFRQRTAGLRTNVLVAIGAAAFVDLANRMNAHEGVVHVAAYVVSGVGFLGAGVIMREEGNVRGLNTAATLWGSAAVGAAAGADLVLEATLVTLFVLAANTLLRPVVDTINRRPIDVKSVEVTNTVYVVAESRYQKRAMAQLEEVFEDSDYPVRDLDICTFGTDEVRIEAVLAATSVDGAELDTLVQRVAASPAVRQAFWSPSTKE